MEAVVWKRRMLAGDIHSPMKTEGELMKRRNMSRAQVKEHLSPQL